MVVLLQLITMYYIVAYLRYIIVFVAYNEAVEKATYDIGILQSYI